MLNKSFTQINSIKIIILNKQLNINYHKIKTLIKTIN